MRSDGEHPILARLQAVFDLRSAQAADAAQAERVRWVKAYQARRFASTYADLLAGGPYQAGARFFIGELYGPQDMSARDAQFARVVPALERLFPEAIQHTVAQLAELHALSESLDDQLARHVDLSTPASDAERYIAAWQALGRAADREHQVVLVQALIEALARHTRSRLLRAGLRAMRGPAQAAGLGALQHFLESGFDTFGAMGDVRPFDALVSSRERALIGALFRPEALAWRGEPLSQNSPITVLAMLP